MGLPGSGKTTFAKTLKNHFKRHNEKYFTFIHVCYDEILPFSHVEIHENEIKWKELRAGIINKVHELLLSLLNGDIENCPKCFKSQLDVHLFDSVIVILIDDNMYLRSMRYAFYKKAKEFNIGFCQVYLKSSLEQCLERNISRSSKNVVPAPVITEMNSKLQQPKMDNKWEKHTLVFQTDNDYQELYCNYFDLLDLSLKNPVSIQNEFDLLEKKKSALICMTNVLHQSDIALRQVISSRVKKNIEIKDHNSKKELQLFCTKLNNTKAKVLNDIKLGIIYLPKLVLTEIKENVIEKKSLKLFIEQMFDKYLSLY